MTKNCSSEEGDEGLGEKNHDEGCHNNEEDQQPESTTMAETSTVEYSRPRDMTKAATATDRYDEVCGSKEEARQCRDMTTAASVRLECSSRRT